MRFSSRAWLRMHISTVTTHPKWGLEAVLCSELSLQRVKRVEKWKCFGRKASGDNLKNLFLSMCLLLPSPPALTSADLKPVGGQITFKLIHILSSALSTIMFTLSWYHFLNLYNLSLSWFFFVHVWQTFHLLHVQFGFFVVLFCRKL